MKLKVGALKESLKLNQTAGEGERERQRERQTHRLLISAVKKESHPYTLKD